MQNKNLPFLVVILPILGDILKKNFLYRIQFFILDLIKY